MTPKRLFPAAALVLALLVPVTGLADNDAMRLYDAIRTSDTLMLADLLDAGISPNTRFGKDSALTLAASRGDIDAMALLMRAGAEPNDDTAMAAVDGGHAEAVEWLIAEGTDVDIADPYGMTLLAHAALHGKAEVAERLIALGADVDAPEIMFHYRPVHLAAAHGHVLVVELLIEAGADLSATTTNGATARSWAEQRRERGAGFREVIALLDAAGG